MFVSDTPQNEMGCFSSKMYALFYPLWTIETPYMLNQNILSLSAVFELYTMV